MTQFRMVYITTSNEEEARRIGRTLVEEKLAACVNILPAMHSIYRWQGEICEGDEAVLIAKTTSTKLDALTQAVLAQHSYDCPCVVALPIEPGNPEYFEWLSESVGECQAVQNIDPQDTQRRAGPWQATGYLLE